MPLPPSHFESLERQLRIHEERIAVLRWQLNNLLEPARDPNPKVRSPEWVAGQREVFEREIRIHEQLIELGLDPKVLDALGDLAEKLRGSVYYVYKLNSQIFLHLIVG